MMLDSKNKGRSWNVTFFDYSANSMEAQSRNDYGMLKSIIIVFLSVISQIIHIVIAIDFLIITNVLYILSRIGPLCC